MNETKGIILAAGRASRLFPITFAVNKQLLAIYDKPMIYYPLSVLMLAQIKDVLLITRKEDLQSFKALLGNGKKLGMKISYAIQKKPRGIADAFIIGKNFIGKNNVALILGDNFFYGESLTKKLKKCVKLNKGAQVILHWVNNPSSYGVAKINNKNKIVKIIEKPKKAFSNLAVTGLYFFDNNVINYCENLKPSKRNEIEIVDLLNKYKMKNKLSAEFLGRGGAWLDTGSIKDFYNASAFVSALEKRQGLKIACLEEIAFNNKWIKKNNIVEAIKFYGKCNYSNYLSALIKKS